MLSSLWACGRAPVDDGSQLTTLANHTPAVVSGAQMTGAVSPSMGMRLRIAMPLRNSAALDSFLGNLYDPQSASYQSYLTPAEFQATYHPDATTVAQLRHALVAAGMQPDDDAHGVFLGASATAQQAEAFFHTKIATYQDANGTSFFAPSESVSVANGLPINAVFGLHTVFPAHANMQRIPTLGLANTAQMNAADIRKAYNVPNSATGAGQVVALYELDGYEKSDIQSYAQENNLNFPPLTNILVDNFSGTVQNAGDQGEVSLDIEMVNALMPNAAGIRVYETSNNGSGIDEYNEIANPTLGDKLLVSAISTSWGAAEDTSSKAELQSEGDIFKQMAAQGQSLLAASGDSGARADGTTLSVGDPASQPFVVAVGGTTLSTQSDGSYASESAWSGGGGGISAEWPIPTWQKSAVVTDTQGSGTMRNVPDVALNADPGTGYSIFVAGQNQGGVGGTSCAAPLWTGMVGLANQARAQMGLGPLGFLSPALYFAAQNTTYYSAAFHDVQSGNNGAFNAGVGYDNATGLGSYDANNFIQVFASGYARSTFGAPAGLAPSNP